MAFASKGLSAATACWMVLAALCAASQRAAAETKTVWADAAGLRVEGKGWEDTESFYGRLPARAEGSVPASVWGLGHDSAGLLARFVTDATTVHVRWKLRDNNLALPHMPATGVGGVDLYARGEDGRWRFVNNGRPTETVNTASFTVEPGRELMLYLPLYNGVDTVEIGAAPGFAVRPPGPSDRDARKPIVFYGTSITQGACASRPGMAATAIAGRELDWPVINLGFSGSGKMEPAMADLLAELDPAVYVLDCLWNMTPEMVGERVAPFVKTLRAARPDTPILLAEDSSVRATTPTPKGRILRRIFNELASEGVTGLRFLSNEGMLGDDFDGTVDGCHPNDLGMARQAAVFVNALRPLLNTTR